MANRFANFDLGAGNNDGTTAANAWRTMQAAIDGLNDVPPAAGETVWCMGTDTLAAQIDMDGASGSLAAGYIKWVGCSSLDPIVVDGTKAVLDGNAAVADILTAWSAARQWMENFEITNATDDGVASVGDACIFVNVSIHDNAGDGMLHTGNDAQYWRCQIFNNGSDGVQTVESGTRFICSAIYNNAEHGINAAGNDTLLIYGCAYHDNGNNFNHVNDIDNRNIILNNVFDGTDQTGEIGIEMSLESEYNIVAFNRFTNLVTGISADDGLGVFGYNLFHNNTNDVLGMTVYQAIPMDADADTNEYDPDVDDGYNDVAKNDFNLKASRTYNGDGNDVIPMKIGTV